MFHRVEADLMKNEEGDNLEALEERSSMGDDYGYASGRRESDFGR